MGIVVDKICKKYKHKNIFDNFSITINDGEMVAIMGESGKGKTTLLNMIGLIESPDDGKIIINGIENPCKKEMNRMNLFRYTIGYLFQNYALIDSETVDKNLDVALEYVKGKNKKEMKLEALKRVGLEDKLNNKIYELSGGEQQRVSIARLLLKKNDIILADEPTGALDNLNKYKVINLLRELNKEGKTILIVTHDKEVGSKCDRIINL